MTAGLIEPPNTELTTTAEQLLADLSPVVRAHCERSYQFAAMLVSADGVVLDTEALYLGVLLHDVGLAASCDGAERFEVRGANAVRSWLLDRDVAPARAELVWDVIALHASTPLARHKSPETSYANRGISIDIRGQGHGGLDAGFVRAVLDAWPRAAFPTDFEAILADEVQRRPDTVRLSWLESVAVRYCEGHQPADFLAGLRASAEFR